MTILAYVKTPGFELIVCGSPSREWLEWVRTTDLPLTQGQAGWREIAQRRVDRLADVAGYPRKVEQPQVCRHRDECDRCRMCEVCACECHEVGAE